MDVDLQINISHKGEVPVLELIGEVDAYTCPRLRDAMVKALDGGQRYLIISMIGVEYIDSSGLGALVGGLKRVSEKEGRIYIVCANSQVMKVFQITGLVKVFPIFETLNEAQSAVNEELSAVVR